MNRLCICMSVFIQRLCVGVVLGPICAATNWSDVCQQGSHTTLFNMFHSKALILILTAKALKFFFFSELFFVMLEPD